MEYRKRSTVVALSLAAVLLLALFLLVGGCGGGEGDSGVDEGQGSSGTVQIISFSQPG